MFDRISPRYDLLNRVLSLGTDVSWRRRAISRARLGAGERAVDVGVGTGDLSAGLLAASAPTSSVVGLDLAPRMLEMSGRRLRRYGARYASVVGSATALPFRDAAFDRIVTGFTIRNVGDLPRALREFRRVLRPGGRAVLLELSHPVAALAPLYWWYFERVAPLVAVALGGDRDAYRYLPRSLRAFPTAERLAALVRDAGFARVRLERLTLGIAALVTAERDLTGPA
ncbi:MAG: ubiquinone/menaquinone biosynthesis methyltransferase [Chloroflexota bacterium]|nr:ubiquinone/menaquinone biosynthesis methyltransferase [Chloroflexota bacterium]MDE3193754.1 ubiquinone/menaquinone biosynthesis methyltransferase [Chloroflexota bacterium]